MAESGATAWHQRALAEITRWPWLQRLNDQASAAVDPVYDRFRANPAVEILHGGRWLGHSLHPALSDLPIGFWSATVLLDMAGQDVPANGARLDPSSTLSAAGIAAAAATAATGLADWSVSDNEDRRVGLFHGLLNGAGTLLQGVSLAARLSGHRRTGRALGAASLTVTVAAAYVGGHLVQGRALMVNRVAANTGPQRWVKAVAEDDLAEGAITGVEVEGRQVLLHRRDGEVHAIDDVCSHAGALLHRGEVEGCTVVCPLHYSVFDLRDGRIVRGPAHHPQPVLPARVRNGWIEVRGSAPPARSRRSSS
ncbi:non-heme iron oxygenase ferredoxin subunit [Actinomycetospora flava]|uniref:Non-heme iron oxygenase ferredoxin subunit n=1 Tax=Actinomycetospora flava TaxID=3129232 RepID=A0ABU8M1H0_9PSEU